MTLDPPGRTFKEIRKKGRIKDVDAAARAEKIKALGWALFGGLPIGAAAGFAAGHIFLGALLGPIFIWIVVMVMTGVAGQGAGIVFMPSGSTTPRKKEHSRAEALAAQGDFEAAIIAYQAAILDAPEEGEPYLRIARLLRDEVKSPEEAIAWFRRALAEAELSRGREILTLREMSELLIHNVKEPRRAAPHLARLADAHPDTPEGAWAREELDRIKKEMAQGEEPF